MKKWIVAIILIIVLAVVGFAVAGWSERPIIDYSLTTLPDNYDSSNSSLMFISIGYDNRGDMDAAINLIVTVTNANITSFWNSTYEKSNGTQAVIYMADNRARAHSPFGDGGDLIVQPIGNPQNFTITYTIEDVSPVFSINGIISHLFLEQHGNSPTIAVYNRTETTHYQLLK